ncbi:adenylyltransferase and sulfurtransferase, partial [Tanacetum coccineum]
DPLELKFLTPDSRISSKEYNEEGWLPEISSALNSIKESFHDGSDARLYLVCRRGNDSQSAVDLLHKAGFTSAKDIVGGLDSWAHDVDQRFPTY